MSTETTFYEDEHEDLFINKDLLTNEICIYYNYPDGGCTPVPPKAIAAMYAHMVEHVMKGLDNEE